jgi:hypothetical protein
MPQFRFADPCGQVNEEPHYRALQQDRRQVSYSIGKLDGPSLLEDPLNRGDQFFAREWLPNDFGIAHESAQVRWQVAAHPGDEYRFDRRPVSLKKIGEFRAGNSRQRNIGENKVDMIEFAFPDLGGFVRMGGFEDSKPG